MIGGGPVAKATAAALVDEGVRELVVATRTATPASALAARVGGRGVGFDRLTAELAEAAVVISATGAPHLILTRDQLARVMAGRPGRPMLLIDIAVPRDLDPGIAELPGVSLRDIDDLERVVEAAVNGRRLEAARAERLVAEELGRFLTWCRAVVATPTIASLHDRAEAIRQEAIARQEGRWEGLCAADRARLEHLTRSIVGKLLHEPTVRLRAAVEDGDGNAHLASLRHLFALEGPMPSADAARGIS